MNARTTNRTVVGQRSHGPEQVAASSVAAMADVALGVLPVFKDGIIEDPAHTRAFVRMLEAEGVESVWAVEHGLAASDPV